LPENLTEFESSLKQNTIYVKGLPTTLTLDDLMSFFEKNGKVLSIFMRRFPASKQFKGSVFVTFSTNDEMKKLLDLAELKYEDQVLLKESQEDYFKRKGPEIQKLKDSKAKKDQEKQDKEKKRIEAEEAYLKEKQVPGAVLQIQGLNAEGTRENIKELFDSHARVQGIDDSKGEPEAFLRFAEANTAKEALEKAKGDKPALVLKGATLEVRVIEGDEEAAYWRDSLRKQATGRSHKAAAKKFNRRQGGGGRDKWGGKRKRGGKRDDDDDDGEEENSGPAKTADNKKTKFDEEKEAVTA